MRWIKNKKVVAIVQNWIKPILVVVIVVGSFRSAVADWNDVPTGSMKPTILKGDRIFVNKLAYDLKIPFTQWRLWRWSDPRRGDVVVFFSPDQDIRMVKRIVGLPGDRIELRSNRLIINGEEAGYAPLTEKQLAELDFSAGNQVLVSESIGEEAHPVLLTPRVPARRWFAPITVPDGHFFAMGDNRDNSRDSRWFGVIARDQIVGRTSRVAISFQDTGWHLPRWGRTLHRLP